MQSEFRNKILMPILFENATRNVTMGDSPRKRIGHDVIERRKKELTGKVRDLYKRRDEGKLQSVAMPASSRSSKSLSATKLPQNQSSSTVFLATPSKCRLNHPSVERSEARLYRTNIERMQLINEIESRKMAATSSNFRVRQQPAVQRTRQNIFELDFEKEVPKLSELKWLIEAQQYNADRLEQICKKIAQKNMNVKTLAERQKQLRTVEIIKYIDTIDVEGVDNKLIQQREELNERFKGVPGFLDELARKEQLRDQKFKSPVKRATATDDRLATGYQNNSPFVKGIFQQTTDYERWKSPLNRDIEEGIRVLEGTLQTSQPVEAPTNKIMLEYLKESRLERLGQTH